MIYWDTSCVIKLYTLESDSLEWQQRALEAEGDLVASALMRTEVCFALEQKELRGEILPGGASALLEIIDHDIDAGRFCLFPVGTDVLQEACAIATTCFRNDPPLLLRTLDGIHLATARLMKCKQVATTDKRMRDGAGLLGLGLL